MGRQKNKGSSDAHRSDRGADKGWRTRRIGFGEKANLICWRKKKKANLHDGQEAHTFQMSLSCDIPSIHVTYNDAAACRASRYPHPLPIRVRYVLPRDKAPGERKPRLRGHAHRRRSELKKRRDCNTSRIEQRQRLLSNLSNICPPRVFLLLSRPHPTCQTSSFTSAPRRLVESQVAPALLLFCVRAAS